MLETINMTTTEEGFTTTNSLQEPTHRALNFDGSFGKFISQHKVYNMKKESVVWRIKLFTLVAASF